jgi:hypothetical protein
VERGADFEKDDQLLIKSSAFLFHDFYTILHFNEFCRTRYFKFFNLILTNNLEIDYFGDFFYSPLMSPRGG